MKTFSLLPSGFLIIFSLILLLGLNSRVAASPGSPGKTSVHVSTDFIIEPIGPKQGVSVNWSATNAVLETRTNLAVGNWIALSNTASPYFEFPGLPMDFFRLNFGQISVIPPTAMNDFYVVSHDQILTVPPPGILANDVDYNDMPLIATLTSSPLHGTLEPASANPDFSDGGFNYTPDAGYVGGDSFTYVASDELGQVSAETFVIITVSNSPPVAVGDAYAVQENQTLDVEAPGILSNDTDADGDLITPTLVNLPANGTLTGSGGTANTIGPDGGFTYTPDAGFVGEDSFTYYDSDGIADGNTATVTLTVHSNNTPPVVVDSSFVMAQDSALTTPAPGVLTGATDADGDALTAELASGPIHGTLNLSADGSFEYIPANGYVGNDTFTFEALDGQTNGNIATVTITVTNSQPLAAAYTYYVHTGAILSVPASGVLANDFSPVGDSLSAELVTGPSLGTLQLNADGSFTYTNASSGVDDFTYEAMDTYGDSTSAPAIVTIIITNRPPVAVADSYGVHTNLTLNVPAPGVLANDSDPDGDPLTAVLYAPATHGNAMLNPDGSFTYAPDPGFVGLDSFTYAASDGLAPSAVVAVTLEVHATNDAPLSAPSVFTIRPNETLVITNSDTVLNNDLDDDNDVMSATLLSSPANGTLSFNANGDFVYVPNDGFVGQDGFSYQPFDGLVSGTPTSVYINVDNTPPFANPDVYEFHFTTTNEAATNLSYTVDAPGVLENDGDDDQDLIKADLVSGPTNGTVDLDEDGSFTYTPNPGFIGTDTFTYQADDGFATSPVTTVTLQMTDTAPVAQPAAYSMDIDTTLTNAAPGILDYAYDDDDDPLTAVLASQPVNGVVTLNPDGSFNYVPNSGFTGTDQFSYAVTDGGLTSAPASVTITVLATPHTGVHFPLVAGGATLRMVTFDNFGNTPPAALQGLGFTPTGKMIFSDWGALTSSENRLKPVGKFGLSESFGYRWTDPTGNGFIGPLIKFPSGISIGYPYIYNQGSTLSAAVSLYLANLAAGGGTITLTGDIYWDKNFGNVTMVGQNYKLGSPTWTITSSKAWAGNVGLGVTTFNLPFAIATGSFPQGLNLSGPAVGRHQMSIVWHYNNGGIEKVCGVSKHTIYLNYARSRLIYNYWTELDAGCQLIPALASSLGQSLYTRAIFQNTFRSGNLFALATPSQGNVKRVDGAPLSYYGSAIQPANNAQGWNKTSPGWLAPEAFTATDLLRYGSGWNLGWGRLFQEMLWAQGLADANNNGLGILTPVTATKRGSGFLLKGTMANAVVQLPGQPATTTFVPSAPYAPGTWVYPSYGYWQVTPATLVPANAGWKFVFYKNLNYTPAPGTVKAQNSVDAGPPNWWYQDWVINVNGTLYDPTYGLGGSISDIQGSLVDGTFSYIGDQWWSGPPIRLFPTFKMNKVAALKTQNLTFSGQPANAYPAPAQGNNIAGTVVSARSFSGGGAAAGTALPNIRVTLTIWKYMNGRNYQVNQIYPTQRTGAAGTATFPNIPVLGSTGFAAPNAGAIYTLVATAPGCAAAVSSQFTVGGP